MTTDDMELVRQYAADRSEPAFAALVSRYTNLVYSAALRQVGHPPLAEEITQAVFILLARKAGSLDEKTILSGWLYRTAGYVSAGALKQERRRRQRESEAYMQSTLNEIPAGDTWPQLSPLLDEAMLRLSQADRDALVLRYFEGRSLGEVGTALGTGEDAAKKRVARAVDKLRKFFARRGVVLTATALAGTISVNSVSAAPAGLAQTISVVAVAKGVAAGTSTLTLVKGALKLMAWTKMKTAIVVGVCVLLAAGTATVAVKAVHSLRPQPDISGAWEGIVQAQAKMRLVLKVVKENGRYHATADSVDQRTKDIPVNVFDYDSPKIHLEMESVKGAFDGSFNSAATQMSGTWDQSSFGLVVPLTLKRTDSPSTVPELLAESDYAPRAGSALQGYWLGTVNAGAAALRVAFKISDQADGTFLAEMDSLDQGADNLVVSSISYNKPTVRIEVGLVGGVFEGDLAGTEIQGTWTQLGKAMSLTLKRTDPKVIQAQAAASEAQKDYSHTSPDDLPGHWKGALVVQGITLHLLLHVAKLPGGGLSGTLDSLDQGVNGLPADVVRFTPPAAHLEWKTIGGVYEGTIGNGTITGKWSQLGQAYPLVFEREPAQ